MVSCTTRIPREKEIDGHHYHFVSKEQFKDQVTKGDFLEWVEFDDNYYGTLYSELESRTTEDHIDIPILETELEGMISAKKANINGLYIFLAIKDLDVLKERLEKRGTQTPQSIAQRLEIADRQMTRARKEEVADVWVVNDEIFQTMNQIIEHVEKHFGVEAESDWMDKVASELHFN